MGLDARTRYSKMMICKSVAALLREKPFHCIRVTEVCQCAGINRTTFYKYYRDMPDWKEQLEKECLSSTREVMSHCAAGDLEEVMTRQFREMRELADLYMLISSPHFESNVMETMISITLEHADAQMKQRLFGAKGEDFRHRWDCYYAVYGCLGVIRCWIENGMREPPETVAAYYTEHLRHALLHDGSG